MANVVTSLNALLRRADSPVVDIRRFGARHGKESTAAIQSAIDYAGETGLYVYIPPGIYYVSQPLVATWYATSLSTMAGIIGSGYQSVLYGTGIAIHRGVLELLGESNPYSVLCELSNFRVRQTGVGASTSHKYSYCVRVGDSKSFRASRLWLDGANGIQLIVASSASYAQMCTILEQVSVISNYNNEWSADNTTADVFALAYSSGGAAWDNVSCRSCTFQGCVYPRGSIVNFDNCQFSTPPMRPSPYHCNNVFLHAKSASFRSCYFEDHITAVYCKPNVSPYHIDAVAFDDCHFSGATNYPGYPSQYGVRALGDSGREVRVVRVNNCRFGQYTESAIRVEDGVSDFDYDGLTYINAAESVVVDDART